MTTETLEERATRLRKEFFSPRNEFAHNHNPLHVYSRYVQSGRSKEDSIEIAKHYEQTLYAPLMNLAKQVCLR